ncbi:glycosyltransferase [Kitasatospora sp. NPDC015120]|uniref:glycosyltransferase n=1 Tax=Kitasatospora sp. NPDC015120 TaxID=3364023 RepID=UPI0036F45594
MLVTTPTPVQLRAAADHFTLARAPRTTARAAVLRRLLVTEPRGVLPHWTGRIAYRDADLERVWTSAAQLRPLIVWAGTLTSGERLPLLLAAFAAASSTLPAEQRPVLLVCGGPDLTGPDSEHPVDLAHALGIPGDVFVAGHRHHTEMPAVYGAADAFLTTATTTGASLWEAMVSGCPPIAVTGTGAEHAITNGGHDANGWLADPDPAYLAAAIAQVCIAPAERRRRGTAAATWARQHQN